MSTILSSSSINTSTYKVIQERLARLESLILETEQGDISSDEFKTRIVEGWLIYMAEWDLDSGEMTFEAKEKNELRKFRDDKAQ